MIIQASSLTITRGDRKLIANADFLVQPTDRIGLVGRNGAGKSTLLQVLAARVKPDGGSLQVNKRMCIGYMPQEQTLISDRTVLQEALSAHAYYPIAHEIMELEERAAHGATSEELARLSALQLQLEQFHIPHILQRTVKILRGIGFSEPALERAVNELSVGWKMRVVLAQLLVQEADFYLFDEPTNHLDIIAQEWFLQFIAESSFGFMLVSHDKAFLDKLCTTIYEIERGTLTMYPGNYSQYCRKKEEELITLQAQYELQQREIARKQATIDRFRASASKARMAQSMIKELEAIERIELPPILGSVNFSFTLPVKSGAMVLTVKNLQQEFGTKSIFKQVNFELKRGTKTAIVAANGVGKTTLLNTILGKLPQHGVVEWGYNVHIAAFEQESTNLPAQMPIFDYLLTNTANKSDAVIRNLLGAFLFSGNDIYKKLGVLSGGEKNRVKMCQVLLQDANVLLLDEPTNHLDIDSKERLLQALLAYPGTILFVSHDRDFVNSLASNIIELTPTAAYCYEGNYEQYLYYKEAVLRVASSSPQESTDTTKNAPLSKPVVNDYETRKECKKLEQQINKWEQEIAAFQAAFAHHEYGTVGYNDLIERVQAQEKKLQQAQQRWEELMTTLLS